MFSFLSQVVKSGSSETRVEKRIVITADSDIDQDKVQTLYERMVQNKTPRQLGSRLPMYFGIHVLVAGWSL